VSDVVWTDLCTTEGAVKLAKRIEMYWAERGYLDVEVAVVPGCGIRGNGHGEHSVCGVRSNLYRGLPRSWRRGMSI
jgi:hypothetical protein